MTTIGNGQFHVGDCLDVMRGIPDASVEMILCDLPYGTTACSWDAIIPFEAMWAQYWRVVKPSAAIILTASQPFTTALIGSALADFKYCWVWHKSKVSGFTNAKNKPLNTYEDVCVFSRGACANRAANRMNYYPQGLSRIDKTVKNTRRSGADTIGNRPSRTADYVQEFTGYPKNVIELPSEGSTFHPTQKPVALFEYLIRTYTNEGDTVLDNCAGSGTTAIAAENAKRRWVCIERDQDYATKAVARIRKHVGEVDIFG